MKKKLIVFLLLGLGYFQHGVSQVPTDLQLKFQQILDNALVDPGVKGISACVIMPDSSIWTGQAGDNGSGVSITDSTVFYGGSTTKTFVATRIMQLWEDGLINLDTTYTAYIDTIKNVLPETTIRQMLNHTSGIFNVDDHLYFIDSIINNPTHIFTPSEIYKYFLDQPHYFAPGTNYKYSNTNYTILGTIIEAITGNPLHEELRNNVFNLIPLNHTYSGAYEPFTEPYCGLWAYNSDSSMLLDYTAFPHAALLSTSYGNGNIVTYPLDEALFIRKLINGNILSDSAMSEMLQMNPFSNYYGLGIAGFESGQDTMYYGHDGQLAGNLTYMFHWPKLNLTIVVMENSENGNFLAFAELFYSALNPITVGINKNKNDNYSLSVYPNPAKDELNINFGDSSGNEIMEIYSVNGSLIRRYPLINANNKIDISNYSKGLYMVRIKSDKSDAILKFIKN